MPKYLILFLLGLMLTASVSCSKDKPSPIKKPAPTVTKKLSSGSMKAAKRAKEIKKPDPVEAAKKADDASVADIRTIKNSVAMYDNMYEVFAIIHDNLNNCDLAVQKVKAYAKAHRDKMLKAQDLLETQNKSMSKKDKSRYADWKQRRDMQMVNDSMKLMIEFNYRCKAQMIKINAQIVSLSSR